MFYNAQYLIAKLRDTKLPGETERYLIRGYFHVGFYSPWVALRKTRLLVLRWMRPIRSVVHTAKFPDCVEEDHQCRTTERNADIDTKVLSTTCVKRTSKFFTVLIEGPHVLQMHIIITVPVSFLENITFHSEVGAVGKVIICVKAVYQYQPFW